MDGLMGLKLRLAARASMADMKQNVWTTIKSRMSRTTTYACIKEWCSFDVIVSPGLFSEM